MEEETYNNGHDSYESVRDQPQVQQVPVEVKAEAPLFKFKRGARLVAGVEVSSVKKWVMLVHKEYQGDTTFAHFCLYRDKEFGKVTGVHVFTGFMKGERFVPTRNRVLENKGFNDFNVISRLTGEMERLAREGYSKDESQYTFGEPGNPSYFKDPEDAEEEEVDENNPEADLKKAAALLTQKRQSLLKSMEDFTKNLGGIPTPSIGPTLPEDQPEATIATEYHPITDNTSIITLFRRKSK